MHYTTPLIRYNFYKDRLNMLQIDFTFLILWYVIPFALLGLRAVLAGYRAYQKKQEMRQIEERITPFTSEM